MQHGHHEGRHHQVGELFEDAVKSIYELREVPEAEEFVLPNGDHIKSLLELQSKLIHMDEDIFNYHVNEWKNDFASWIYNTIGDQGLAAQLGPLKTRAQNAKAIKERVRQLVTHKIKHA